MEERRKADRRRTYLCGRIAFNNRYSTLDCLIRNLSRNGALLEFSDEVVPPHEIDLCILSRGESRRARLIWSDGARAGFSTDHTDGAPVISIETARLILKLKADRERLAQRVARLSGPT